MYLLIKYIIKGCTNFLDKVTSKSIVVVRKIFVTEHNQHWALSHCLNFQSRLQLNLANLAVNAMKADKEVHLILLKDAFFGIIDNFSDISLMYFCLETLRDSGLGLGNPHKTCWFSTFIIHITLKGQQILQILPDHCTPTVSLWFSSLHGKTSDTTCKNIS